MSLANSVSFGKNEKCRDENSTCVKSVPSAGVPVNESSSFSSDVENSLVGNKSIPFKKSRLPLQQVFSVSFQESYAASDTEESSDFIKPKQVFRKCQSAPDPFNTFNNKTGDLTLEGDIDKFEDSIESTETSLSVSIKSNPFKKQRISQSKIFNIDHESTTKSDLSDSTGHFKIPLFKNAEVNSKSFQISFNESKNTRVNTNTSEEEQSQVYEKDSINVTKRNPFKNTTQKQSNDAFQVELQESTYCNDSVEHSNASSLFKKPNLSNANFDVTYCTQTSHKKLDETNKNESINKSEITVEQGFRFETSPELDNKDSEELIRKKEDEETNNRRLIQESTRLFDEWENNNSAKNASLSIHSNTLGSKNSNTFLNDTSYNDDNLKYWMSDHSDEEIHLPCVPKIPSNTSNVSSGEKKKSFTHQKTPSKETGTQPSWEEIFNKIVSDANNKSPIQSQKKTVNSKNGFKKKELNDADKQFEDQNKYRPQKLKKPAPFATKRLYHFIINKLNPKFGIDSAIEAENLVLLICETVKVVTRRTAYQKKLIQNLKKKLALAGVIETTIDFYEFVIKYLPYNFRVKVVPCQNPVTNSVYPPRDVTNPFDKII